MELINYLRNLFGGKSSADTPIHEEYDMLLDPELLEGMVDVHRRAEIITTHYETVTKDQAQFIAEILERNVTGYELSKYEAKKKSIRKLDSQET